MFAFAPLFAAAFFVAGVCSAIALPSAVPPGVALSGVLHAVIGVVDVSMSAVVARTIAVCLMVVLAGVISTMTSDSVAVNTPEGVVPGAPSPPKCGGVGTLPSPVAVVTYPNAIMVMRSPWLPPVGVGPLKNAPVARDVRDGVWVVVPIMMMAMTLVQVGIADEVKDSFDLVDKIFLGVEGVAVFVQVALVTPGAQFFGDGVRSEVFVHGERTVCLRGTRAHK